MMFVVLLSTLAAGCINAPDYPDAPASGVITLRNNLAGDAVTAFRVRPAGGTEWKGYNYIALVIGGKLDAGMQIDFHVPPGRLDLRVESNRGRYWTFTDFVVDEGGTRVLDVTQ
jgi:hypothetical protein